MSHQPGLLRDQPPALEDREVRNPAHVVPRRKLLIVLGIDLQDQGATLRIRRRAGHLGSSHVAWSAPLRPEVHQHRNACLTHNLVEKLHIHGNRLVDRSQLILAVTAPPRVRKMTRGDAIFLATVRAATNQGHGVGSN